MIKRFNDFMKKMKLRKYNEIIKKYKISKNELSNKTDLEIKELLLNEKELNNKLALISLLTERFLGLTPYDTQIKGALVLMDASIAEMKTGEGKTLSVIIALILNYLDGNNAHVITANDYLVKRDFELSKTLFEFLGISSGFVYDGQNYQEKKAFYDTDVLYSTSKNLVFDYLNNNRFMNKEYKLNEKRDFVIIDEVDFVLIDEARTPIIVSGMIETDRNLYTLFQDIQSSFVGEKHNVDLKLDDKREDVDFVYSSLKIDLTERGFNLLEKKLLENNLIQNKDDLYTSLGVKYIKSLERAIKANYVLKEDVDYIKDGDEIIIINPQTMRPQRGRRFSDGVHQALEAKEKIEIQNDAKTLGQTTVQNYLRKYKKISGTTGTALTDEIEFREFYNLNVFPIETNKPMIRNDSDDLLFLNKEKMYDALILDIKANIEKGAPTLIGTQSVRESEEIARRLRINKIPFNLLNAKNNEKEAFIIQQAGKSGVVTISTNMAGRGTDIMLGGNKDIEIENYLAENPDKIKEDALGYWEIEHNKVVEAGGLHVLGIERSDSRRADNQLIGRSGRQGDPGFTKFYLTLDDILFESVSKGLLSNNWEKENSSAGMSSHVLNNIVRTSQKSHESMGFNMRKNLLRFDNINTEQREIFYDWRNKILESEDMTIILNNYLKDVLKNIISSNITNETFIANDFSLIDKDFEIILGVKIDTKNICEVNKYEDEDDLLEFIYNGLSNGIKDKMNELDANDAFIIEKDVLLKIMDELWAENISNLEQMRQNTSLRSYAQKNPFDEYQQEALEMFKNLILDVKKDFINVIIKFNPMHLIEQKEKNKEIMEKQQEKETIIYDKNKENSLPKHVSGIGF